MYSPPRRFNEVEEPCHSAVVDRGKFDSASTPEQSLKLSTVLLKSLRIPQPSKLMTRVRFPSPAPAFS
jgi:hypothetical protein